MMQNAIEILEALSAKQHITNEEYVALAAAIQAGPPLGDSAGRYTVFLIEGAFSEEDAPFLRFDDMDYLELGAVLRIAMRQDFDVVVRWAEQPKE